jgi:hypothetical protein
MYVLLNGGFENHQREKIITERAGLIVSELLVKVPVLD